jgi:very-short-patch-repair endonuclease
MVYLGRSVTREMYFGAKPDMFRMADRMRKNPTEVEKILWKQHPIDFYIADFYCHRLKLVIEVDGEIHETEKTREHDDGRTGHLEHFGIKVIRFTNEEVINNNEFVIEQIKGYINELASPALLGAGDGRR